MFLPLVRIALGVAGLLRLQMYHTDFLSVMTAELVNGLRTGMSKILYLLICRFLRRWVFSFLVRTAFKLF